jgi:hypothetical protein
LRPDLSGRDDIALLLVQMQPFGGNFGRFFCASRLAGGCAPDRPARPRARVERSGTPSRSPRVDESEAFLERIETFPTTID